MSFENGKAREEKHWAVAMLGDAQLWIPLLVLLGGLILLGMIR